MAQTFANTLPSLDALALSADTRQAISLTALRLETGTQYELERGQDLGTGTFSPRGPVPNPLLDHSHALARNLHAKMSWIRHSLLDDLVQAIDQLTQSQFSYAFAGGDG